jgi:hypothetical protein
MALQVTLGATLQCSFGAAPSDLTVLPISRVTNQTPVATIMDHIPLVNILPFGMCSTESNPLVAAATAAALGALTPVPCIPVTTSPWVPGVPTVLVGGNPALDNNCKLMCEWGGVIQIVSPGQMQVTIP